MKSEVLNPVLLEPHFKALDRRVFLILKSVRQCVQQRKDATVGSDEPPIDEIIIDDGF